MAPSLKIFDWQLIILQVKHFPEKSLQNCIEFDNFLMLEPCLLDVALRYQVNKLLFSIADI